MSPPPLPLLPPRPPTPAALHVLQYWSMWKLPMFGCSDGTQVLKEIDACKKAFPNAYVRLVAFDPSRQVQVAGGAGAGSGSCIAACTSDPDMYSVWSTVVAPRPPSPPLLPLDSSSQLTPHSPTHPPTAGFLVHRPPNTKEWRQPSERSV